MGSKGDSRVGTIIRYRFTHSATTIKKDANAIQVGFLVLGMATISMGSNIPATLENRKNQPYFAGLNIFSITSLSHLAEENQSVRYSENVKYP